MEMTDNTSNDASDTKPTTSNFLHTPHINIMSNVPPLINPVLMVQKKGNPEITATTKLNVSRTTNGNSNSDTEQLSPTRTSRSSTISTLNDEHPTAVKKSTSHSKITDLAHKMTDYLFATRRSIDTHNPSTASSADGSTRFNTDSSNPSPTVSRDNSHVSLSSLARIGGRQLKTKRRSFLSRPNMSPPRDNPSLHTYNNHSSLQHELTSASLTYNNSSTSLSSRNGNFATNEDDSQRKNSHVKETHYVHVAYDPVTRKRILNTYEILSDLGAGQHGKVKLAKHIDTGKLVAIKIVDRTGKPALMLSSLSRGKTQTQEDKIRKEIAIMKKCDHPHVVKLIEVLDADNSRKIYLVLEYLEKGEVKWQITPEEVASRLAQGGDTTQVVTYEDCVPEPLLTWDETRRIFRDTLCGLEYLHHQGIIHRDIKPSNLLVGKDNEVKISDFGVSFASNLDGEHQDDVELARTAGTPAFLAPELCGTSGRVMKVTYKIDIWALGVTLYCLLFGKLPFHAESEYKLFEKINNMEVEFPDMTRWRVSKQLSPADFEVAKDLLLKLLDKNSESRIEIDEIRKHKFLSSGFPGDEWLNDYTAWNKNMKIDVSNEEVNDAIVGLGNRIKKRITAAFRRRKLSDRELGDDDTSGSVSSIVRSFPMLGLKEDCSYILSEENNKTASKVSLSLLNDSYSCGKFSQSRPTTGISMANAKFDLEHSDDDIENNQPLESSSPSNINTTGNTSMVFEDENGGNSVNEVVNEEVDVSNELEEVETDQFESCKADTQEEQEYDYRDDLQQDTQAVNLTVNPSFASLDSFYDDSYSKFMNPSTSIGFGFGSVSSRSGLPTRNSARIPSNSSSPVIIPIDHTTPNLELNEMTSVGRRITNSPSNGFTLSGLNASNMMRGNRMNKTRSSPIQSTANMNVFNANNALRNAGVERTNSRSQRPANPMITRKEVKPSIVKKPINTQSPISPDDPKSMSPTEELKPKVKPTKSFSSPLNSPEGLSRKDSMSRRAIFTSGNNDSDDEDDDDSDESISFFSPKLTIEASPRNDAIPRALNRSSIYGTKINLIQHAFNDSSDDEDSEGSDEELYMSFGKGKQKPAAKKPSCLPQLDTNHEMVTVDNVFAGSTPTMVDVPANIYQSESSSMGNDEQMGSQSFIMAGDKRVDEIAVIDNMDDDLFDQR